MEHLISKNRSLLRAPILAGLVLVVPFLLHAADGPVAEVQEALKKERFYFGESNGRLDDATRGGLRRYQIYNGLPVTGEMDAPTLQALHVTAKPVSSPLAVPSRAQGAEGTKRARGVSK